MSEWSDYRWIVRTMAKGNGVTLISIAKHCGVSNRKLNQILQTGPSKEQAELIAEALGCAGCDLAELHRQMGELSDKYGRASACNQHTKSWKQNARRWLRRMRF